MTSEKAAKVSVEAWVAVYESAEKWSGPKTQTIVGSFKSMEAAEEFVKDEKTDSAIHVSMGWAKFIGIERRDIEIDVDEFDASIKKKIERDHSAKIVTFGDVLYDFYEQAAKRLGCSLEFGSDHFDDFVVFKSRA